MKVCIFAALVSISSPISFTLSTNVALHVVGYTQTVMCFMRFAWVSLTSSLLCLASRTIVLCDAGYVTIHLAIRPPVSAFPGLLFLSLLVLCCGAVSN